MTFTARPYQVDDLSVLINRPRHGLFHEPGGGKTYIAAMFSQYITECTGERVVWTQPGGIMQKNRQDILFATGLDPKQVAIVQGTKETRASIVADPRVKIFLMTGQGFANEYELLPKDIRHIISDEIHLYYTLYGSTRTTNWLRACKKMGAIVPMTGTIIRGRLDSAYPVLHAIGPHYYANERNFLHRHGVFDENGALCGWRDHETLQAILREVGIFRSFKSIYGEEQKIIQVINCVVPNKTWSVYQKLEAAGLIEMEDEFVDAGMPAVNAMRARQVLATPEEFQIKEESAKDAMFKPFIEDCIKSGERIAIFSAHTKEQERLVGIIRSLGGTVGHINGTVSNERRQEIDQLFNSEDLQFVVASAATAGIGFNWGFLDTMLFYSLDYTDDSFVQAYRRGIRGKRERPLRIILLHYPDTIEDRVLSIIDRKSLDHSLVNPDISPTRLYQASRETYDPRSMVR